MALPRPNGGAGHRVCGPPKYAEFLLHMLKNADSNAEFQGLDVDSLVIVHIQVNKAPKMGHRTHRVHGQINPHRGSPGHTEMILLKKGRLFLNLRGGCTEEKDIPDKTEDTKTGNKCSIN